MLNIISISVIFNSDAYEGVIKGLETRRKINKINEQIGLSKKKIVTLDFREQQIMSERKSNRENAIKLEKERLKLQEYNKQLIERRKMLENELKQLEQKEEDLSKKKINLDLEFKKCEDLENAKKEELNKNLEDKRLETENIQVKEVEKQKLQDLLKS